MDAFTGLRFSTVIWHTQSSTTGHSLPSFSQSAQIIIWINIYCGLTWIQVWRQDSASYHRAEIITRSDHRTAPLPPPSTGIVWEAEPTGGCSAGGWSAIYFPKGRNTGASRASQAWIAAEWAITCTGEVCELNSRQINRKHHELTAIDLTHWRVICRH